MIKRLMSEGAAGIGERRQADGTADRRVAAPRGCPSAMPSRERERCAVIRRCSVGIGLYFMLTSSRLAGSGVASSWLPSSFCSSAPMPRCCCPRSASDRRDRFRRRAAATWLVAAPVLERQIGPVRVEGRIVEIDPLPEGYRIVIAPRSVERLDAARLPLRLRIK